MTETGLRAHWRPGASAPGATRSMSSRVKRLSRPALPGRWLRFGGVGALGVGVQLAVLAVLEGAAGLNYAAATFVAVTAALVHNFFWHRAWTWRDRRGHGSALSQFLRFVGVNGLVSLFGNLALMFVLVGAFGLPAVPANVVAIAACGVANYWLGDRVVFGRRAEAAARG